AGSRPSRALPSCPTRRSSDLPWAVVVPALVSLALAAGWWWYRAPCRRLLALGLALILVSYVLIYSARSTWPYDRVHHWTRYQLRSEEHTSELQSRFDLVCRLL